VSTALFLVRERFDLIPIRRPKSSSPPIPVVGTSRSSSSDDRQLAVIRKYAPSKAQSSQSQSRDGINVGEVNALMRRWKPCPDSVD